MIDKLGRNQCACITMHNLKQQSQEKDCFVAVVQQLSKYHITSRLYGVHNILHLNYA